MISNAVHVRFAAIGRTATYFLLPLVALGITSLPTVSGYTLHIGFIIFLAAVGLGFVHSEQVRGLKTVVNALVILLLVGGTGWFLSPFFFLLYLLPVYLGFLYTPAVAFGFLAALIIIFAFSVGEVDIAFDIMTLLSLLLVIPLVIYLRREYLVLRQSRKDILILQQESRIKDLDTIEKLLSNRVTSLGVSVRQPLTFIRQAAALLLEGTLSAGEEKQAIERIQTTAVETLGMIRSFEGQTSANEVLRNEKDGDTAVSSQKEDDDLFMETLRGSGEITKPKKVNKKS